MSGLGTSNSTSQYFRAEIRFCFCFYRQEFPFHWLWRDLMSWWNIIYLWMITWCSHLCRIGGGPYADFGRHHPGGQGTTLLSYPVWISDSGVSPAAFLLSKALHFTEEQSLVNQHGVTFTFPLPLLYKKVSKIAIATEPFLFKGS